jgi:hypothetical protein
MRVRIESVLTGLLLLAAAATGQIVTEERVVTDSVDLFSQPQKESRKSAGLAMAASLVLPGLGHQYLGARRRALVYFGTDVLLVFGAVLSERSSHRIYEDARAYAWTYAGAGGGRVADDTYWQNVGHYLDSRGYNQVQELNGTPEHKYVDPQQQWAWVDEEHMDTYAGHREDAASYHVASSFFIAALVLNRVVAFVDVRIATLRGHSARPAAVRIEPRYSPLDGSLAVSLTRSF